MKITNGGTGPTVQCEGRVLVAHNSGSTPTAASAGTDWKTVWRFGGGTTANAITEQSWEFGPAVMHLEVEFVGNTGQAVTVEAYLSEVTDSQTAYCLACYYRAGSITSRRGRLRLIGVILLRLGLSRVLSRQRVGSTM
jgi:hypothetical protein